MRGGVFLGARECAVILAAILVVPALNSCAGSPKPQARLISSCLPMVQYSPAQQAQAADELAGLPQGAQLGKMMVDYATLRKANRAVCPP